MRSKPLWQSEHSSHPSPVKIIASICVLTKFLLWLKLLFSYFDSNFSESCCKTILFHFWWGKRGVCWAVRGFDLTLIAVKSIYWWRFALLYLSIYVVVHFSHCLSFSLLYKSRCEFPITCKCSEVLRCIYVRILNQV